MRRSEAAIRVHGALKAFGGCRALDGLELEVEAGGWTGLIGPNGAGKTTCLLAIAGLIPLDDGWAEVAGRSVRGPLPDVVGWVPQRLALYRHLTGRENLETFGVLNGVGRSTLRRRIEWALDWTGLAARAEDRVGTYSGGMQRRLNIACAVLHQPRVLLLDEPTVGVDPHARERIFEMLEQLRRDGVALLHSSHELGDIETICDELVILDAGRAVAAGPVSELVGSAFGGRTVLRLELGGEVAEASLPAELDRRADGGYDVVVGDVGQELPALIAALAAVGVEILGLDLRRPGLQDLFLELTGRGLRE